MVMKVKYHVNEFLAILLIVFPFTFLTSFYNDSSEMLATTVNISDSPNIYFTFYAVYIQ